MNEPLSDFNKIISNFKSDGFAKINSFLSDSKELANLKHKLYSLVCIKAKQYNIEIPTESESSINNSILELNSINNKIGAFFNDSLNAAPELFQLLSSKKIINLAEVILGSDSSSILCNNYRIRIQIPGHDDVSNLPWHQDSHYNNFYKLNNSIAIWASITDISDEAGPIIFKKGSHVLKELQRTEFKKSNNHIAYTVPKKYIEDPKFPEYSVSTKSGDVVLIDMNVVHKSGENKSNDKVKLSIQCRCHDAGKSDFLAQYN